MYDLDGYINPNGNIINKTITKIRVSQIHLCRSFWTDLKVFQYWKIRSLLEKQRYKRKEKKPYADAPCILLPCAPALCRNEWAPLSLPHYSYLQQQSLRKNLSSSSKQKKIRMGAKAIQKAWLKDNVCTPIYKKLCLWVFLLWKALLRVLIGLKLMNPSRLQLLIPAPLTPAPFGVLLLLKVGVARGARFPMCARPRGTCHRSGPAWWTPRPGWVRSGVIWLRVGHCSGLNLAIYPKPGSNREGKNAYLAKSYGTLSEYES